MKRLLIVGMMIVAFLANPVQAVEPVKIGMITTLSTKAGYLGEEIRDGFQLAIDQEDGKLGGIPVELLVDDDGRKPEKAKQIAERFIKRDGAKILTGIVFSNVAIAVVPKVVKQDVIYVSPNAGPSLLAGKGCHKNYFNVAYQNDNLDEVVGKYVTDAGFKNVYLLAPNYPAGKDHLGLVGSGTGSADQAEFLVLWKLVDLLPQLILGNADPPVTVFFDKGIGLDTAPDIKHPDLFVFKPFDELQGIHGFVGTVQDVVQGVARIVDDIHGRSVWR